MFQQHVRYGVDLPPGGFRVTARSSKAVQTGVIVHEKNHADVMQAGIIIHDATQTALINTGVTVHDVDSQQDSEADSQGDGGARDTQPNQPKVLSWLGDLWCWFTDNLSLSSELRVRQKHDRDGSLWWDLYDPDTKRSARFSSKSEARIWIEQSYQRQFR